jgi:hypothetical protein
VTGAVVKRLAALAAATLLGFPLALGPLAAGQAVAASPGLTLIGAAHYEVQPEHRRVHITVDLTATNRAKGSMTTNYLYDRANLSVLPGTTAFRATNNGIKVSVSVASRSAKATLLSIHLAKRLGSGKSTGIRLSFELPDLGGRASRSVRIGPSIAAFPVWAYGSRGTPGSTVTVRFPSGYKVSTVTGRLGKPITASDGTTTLSSPVLADPFALSGYVLADRPGAYTETPLEVTVGGVTARFAVRGWKDDPTWAKRTTALLKKALPALGATIGSPFPQTDTIAIEEAVSRSIAGLAGVYDPASKTIRVAYTAGPEVLLREVAHLWFDGSVFADRWTVEGLATLATDGAAKRLGLATGTGTALSASSSSAFPLNDWSADPSGGSTVASEAYGYAASAELVRLIVARTGPDGLQAVLRAAAARAAQGPTDWRGLLDLLQTEAGVDATDLWRTWVVRREDVALLDTRARLAFEHAMLLEEAHGWTLPPAIDQALAVWRFDAADADIAAARSVLEARDDLAVAAAVAGLEPSANLRTVFERGDPPTAAAEAVVERTIIEQIVAAEASGAAASSSWLVRFGLLGQDPMVALADARAAFEAGDLTSAQAGAIAAREAWAGASDLGGFRLRSVGALILIVLLMVLLVRTRARRQPRRRSRIGYESEIG